MYGMFSDHAPVEYAKSVNQRAGRRALVLQWGPKTFEALVPESAYHEQRVRDNSAGETLLTVVAEFDGVYPNDKT